MVVEIADSSLKYDTTEKASLYAAGGIQEYWVVDLVHRKLIVHRNGQLGASAPFGAAYGDVVMLDEAAEADILAAPQASIRVHDLLP